MQNTNILWDVVVLATLVVVVAIGLLLSQRNKRHRSAMLKSRFGNEYDRARAQFGRGADAILGERLRHVEGLHIRALTDGERARFGSAWQDVQMQFVDDPKSAVVNANVLVGEVMRTRGYPKGASLEMRCRDLSVDHAGALSSYRAAEAITRDPTPTTEQLRQAVVHYRVIFADLLEVPKPEHHEAPMRIFPRTV
jgi:hypothetical protein